MLAILTTLSVELWFNTTTNTGGNLIGFGNQQTGMSSSYDRHVYMMNDGQPVFGVTALSASQVAAHYAANALSH